ncbi:MAG: 2-polyprenylphenol 6-hydroxylase [Rhodospirillaceae bacterium]|nr:2-polyprenylphenol 6-hydroxylase [Rhodospirillaceae bacterium]
MWRTLKNIGRLVWVAWTLGRYDALFLITDAKIALSVTWIAGLAPKRRGLGGRGARLAAALQVLGPSFIKFGQALSTRPDLIGEEVAYELSELQDRLPPFSGEAAKRIVEREFNVPLNELFSEFDIEPVAAASIAQVHLARTIKGDEVAVKILRPGIERAFSRDLELFYWLAALSERALPAWRRLKPVKVIRTFAESVAMEMDLRIEAAAASEIRENFNDDEMYRVPAVDWKRTSQRVMTLERIKGVSIDERTKLIAAGHDPREILKIAAGAFFRQVFEDGFFHADLHAGNLLVDDQGRVNAVDFGIMGRLDRDTRRYLAEMLLGFLGRDYERVAEVHFEAGYVPRDKSKAAFTQAIRSIGEPILGKPLHEISLGILLGHLFKVTKAFEMETQPQLLLLQKSLLMAEGLCRRLSPEENMWALAHPQIERWARQNLGAEARVKYAMADAVAVLSRLPRILERAELALEKFENGELPYMEVSQRTAKSNRCAGIHLAFGLIGGLLAALLILQLV